MGREYAYSACFPRFSRVCRQACDIYTRAEHTPRGPDSTCTRTRHVSAESGETRDQSPKGYVSARFGATAFSHPVMSLRTLRQREVLRMSVEYEGTEKYRSWLSTFQKKPQEKREAWVPFWFSVRAVPPRPRGVFAPARVTMAHPAGWPPRRPVPERAHLRLGAPKTLVGGS